MIPPTIILANNSASEASFIGYAKSILAELKSSLAFQGLQQGNSEVSPNTGVLIEVAKHFSIETIRITVDENIYLQADKQKELKEIKNNLDNRFFVRVGSNDDIELDLAGHVIRDDTRYYWIDFFYNESAPVISDQIAFYEPGGMYSVVAAEDTVYYNEARSVSDETFLQAITMLDYMRYNVTRSFDLAVTNEQGEVIIKSRFVAGYNFLSVGDSIIYAPDIPVPSGGSTDLSGVSRNPPNRFVVDLESRTMAWYHVLQRWPEISTYRESTGSVSGIVCGIDIGNGNFWELNTLSTFNFNGAAAASYEIYGTGTNTVYEFQCVASDIAVINREAVTLTLPYRSEPADFVFDLGTASLVSCSPSTVINSTKLIAAGYEWYQTSTYSSRSGETESIPATYVVDFSNEYGFDCTLFETCPDDQKELVEAHSSYAETYQPWSERHINISLLGLEVSGFSKINSGENSFVNKNESIYCRIHYCTLGMNSGEISCGNDGGIRSGGKSLSAFMYANFGSIQNVYAPAQNISLYLGKNDIVSTAWQLTITGPYGSTYETFAECQSAWTTSSPYQGEGPWSVATTDWPQNYPIVDPRTYFNFSNLPISLPELASYTAASTQTWYVPAIADVDTIIDADLCVIDGCPDTKTQSGILQVSILDDRWSAGSQGIVISVKSSVSGESEIYHDGVGKLTAILTALARDNLLGAGENLFDIGLI